MFNKQLLENRSTFIVKKLTIANDGVNFFHQIFDRVFGMFQLSVIIKRDQLHIRM